MTGFRKNLTPAEREHWREKRRRSWERLDPRRRDREHVLA
ncbi:MAG: hypothetical protein JWP87_5638 [Labilithrix sp.]|nr:hypothetical protein [Labilithrix sp.]